MKKIALGLIIILSLLCNKFIYAGDINLLSNIWTGFYIGANAGSSWNKINATTNVASSGIYFSPTDPAQIASAGSQGEHTNTFIGGAQAGYDVQIKKFVLGLEAEIDSLRINKSRSASEIYLSLPSASFTISSSTKDNWLFTLKPKFGYFIEKWLLYATGGLAITNINYNFQFSDNVLSGSLEGASLNQKYGWTAGTGIEVKLSPYWSVRGEYLYVNFGHLGTSSVVYNSQVTPPLATLAHKAGLISQNVTFGVNYKFAYE